MTPTIENDLRPDAVRSPLHRAGEGDSFVRLGRLQCEFSAVLGVARVFVRNQGTEHFITGRPDDILNWARHETRSGEPRYVWRDRGDGVLYGYLRPDD
jgi:hypothetical protein